MNKKVIGYIRVSSQEQVDAGQSLSRQEDQIRQYCKYKNLENLEIIRDEAVSGFKDNRVGFNKLKQFCIQKKVSTVIVFDLSRLSRSVRTTLEFIDDVINANDITFISLSQDINTNTPTGRAFLTISSVFNQLYRDEISYRMKAATRHKKEKGEKVGRVAEYGFDSDKDGKLTVNSFEQEQISLILQLRQQGKSLQEICNHLMSRGIGTKTGLKTWYPKMIKVIIDRRKEVL